jgi:predicted dehydrogenase
MSKKPYRVGIIGAGDTADWRARALRAAGFEITAVASRPGSPRAASFAVRHAVPRTFDGWEDLLAHPYLWDALCIATWPDGTPEILARALPLEVPVLVEKPVAWSSRCLARLAGQAHERVIVGYNRRAYATAEAARREARSGPPLIAQLTLPSDVVVPDDPDPTHEYVKPFFESVPALALDLTRFILGELTVNAIERVRNPAGNLAGFGAVLTTERGDVVQLTGNWGTSANYSLSLSRPGRRFELLPFEIATVYQGLEVLPATDEVAVRRYMPRLVEQIHLDEIDRKEKPGFVRECHILAGLIAGQPRPANAATLADAQAVTTLCEQLTGVRF